MLTNTIKEIQQRVFKEYAQIGLQTAFNEAGKMGDIAELGLIVTEVSEAIEEIRPKQVDYENVANECADIIIRVLNFMSRKHLDANEAIERVNRLNLNRNRLYSKEALK